MSTNEGCRTSTALDRAKARWGMTPTVETYRVQIERPVQEAVAKCVSLRQRLTARPTNRVYKMSCGEIDPLRTAKAAIDDLSFLRDGVPLEGLADFDAGLFQMVESLSDFTMAAIVASNARRDSQGLTPSRRA